jgi:hypothetical protein
VSDRIEDGSEDDDVGPINEDVARIIFDQDTARETGGDELSSPQGTPRIHCTRIPSVPKNLRTSRQNKLRDTSKRRSAKPNLPIRPLVAKNRAISARKTTNPNTMPIKPKPQERIILAISSKTSGEEPQFNIVCEVDGEPVIVRGPVSLAAWLLRIMNSDNTDSSAVDEKARPRTQLSVRLRYESDEKMVECTAGYRAGDAHVVARGPFSLIGWIAKKMGWINGFDIG